MKRDDAQAGTQRPSKTQLKRESEALQKMGEALIDLKPAQLADIEMPDTLREAIMAARGMASRGALHRQRQYIGKVMRRIDPQPIREALDKLEAGSRAQASLQHRCELWREKLLESGDAALAQLFEQHPEIDAQPLRQLIRQSQRERAAGKPPRAFRELYRYLHQALS